jgi:glucosamine kinase
VTVRVGRDGGDGTAGRDGGDGTAGRDGGVVLAVDVGRTALRAAVFEGTTRGASVRLDNGATLSDPDGVARLTNLLDTAARSIGAGGLGQVEAIVIASAGALFQPEAARALLAAVISDWPATPQVVVTTDIVAAHAGALDGQPGVVLAAGTGAVAFAVSGAGETTLVDGAGYLVGDAGSGFTIGRAGLTAALRHHDGRAGRSAALAKLATEQFGPLTDLPGRLHSDSGPARAVASFAPAVAAAARAGDVVAAEIWRDAVAELAVTASAACHALPESDRRLAVTGSLFDLEDLVAEPFSATMNVKEPGVTVRRAADDALAGAARMAVRPAGCYEPLVLRSSA